MTVSSSLTIVIRRCFAVTVSSLALLLFGIPQCANGAIPDKIAQKPVSVSVQNAPVVSVLKSLFQSVGANFSIDSSVRGADTISLNNVTFDAALRSILHANIPKLACDFRDGVFHVSVRKAVDTPASESAATTGAAKGYARPQTVADTSGKRFYKIPIDHADAMLMAMLLRVSKGVSIVPSTTVGGSSSMMGRGGMGMGGQTGMSGMGMSGMRTGGTGMGNMGYSGGAGARRY